MPRPSFVMMLCQRRSLRVHTLFHATLNSRSACRNCTRKCPASRAQADCQLLPPGCAPARLEILLSAFFQCGVWCLVPQGKVFGFIRRSLLNFLEVCKHHWERAHPGSHGFQEEDREFWQRLKEGTFVN